MLKLKRGFTLIELLVVVAIIALLIAILLPSLGRAKANATRVKCAAVLKQWGLVINMYTQENDGWFGTQWASQDGSKTKHAWTSQSTGSVTEIYDSEWPAGAGFKYSAGLHSCPGDPVYGHILHDGTSVNNNFRPPVDYAMCRYAPPVSGKEMWRIGEINHPSSAMLMADSSPTLKSPFEVSYLSDFDGQGPETFQQALDERHMGVGNILFLDGHAEAHSYQDFVANVPTSKTDYSHVWTFQNLP